MRTNSPVLCLDESLPRTAELRGIIPTIGSSNNTTTVDDISDVEFALLNVYGIVPTDSYMSVQEMAEFRGYRNFGLI